MSEQTAFCKACNFDRPHSEFYGKAPRLSFYCKFHMDEKNFNSRMKKKKLIFTPLYSERRVYPIILECGKKAICRDCKQPRSINKFYELKTKLHPKCKYCFSEYRATRKLLKTHIQREESRKSA